MITPADAQRMRVRLVATLESKELLDESGYSIMDIDQRFVDKMFTDAAHMIRWCESWNISYIHFDFPSDRRARSKWVRFKKIVP